MTIATVDFVPTELARGRGGGGPAPTRTVVAFGFWTFLLSDFILFSGLLAAYAVLSGNTAGGPTGRELFNLRNVFIETMCLLVSSYTAGLGALSAERRRPDRFLIFAALTFVLALACTSSGPFDLVCRHGSVTSAEVYVPLVAGMRAG